MRIRALPRHGIGWSFVPAAAIAGALVAGTVGAQSQGDEMKVVILGTGTPIADPERSGPAVAVVVGSEVFLVDAGPGVVRRAAAAAEKGVWPLHPANLTRVFVTHLHSDHTLGLPDLMFTPWQNGRSRPLEVWGPPGIAHMTAKIAEAWIEDVRIRTLGLDGTSRAGQVTVPHEIRGWAVLDQGGVKIRAIPVAHLSWPVALGYRFETRDRIVVVSGDARPSRALIEACNGCDVLVHEVYSKSFYDTSYYQEYHREAHTSTAELARLAIEARPGLLVLYHQLYGEATDADLEREIREAGFAGRVVSASDLDVF